MPRPRNISVDTAVHTGYNAPAPASPTFSETTQASAIPNGPDKIITRANLRASSKAYEDLMNTSATYRAVLLTMSKVTSAFVDAMERCAALKGVSYETGTRLQAASGLHHLIGNHWHVLAETLDRKFERPLRQHFENYRVTATERSASYEKALYEKSRIIQRTEMQNIRRKERNLQNFREALATMQQQVDQLDQLKSQYYQEVMDHEEETWDVVQGKVCVVVRSTMEVFDKFTSKASDPLIESMLQAVPDPFDSYGPPQPDNEIVSIVPPLSISATPSSSSSRSRTPVKADMTDTDWTPVKSRNVLPEIMLPSEWAEVPSTSSRAPSVSPPSSLPSDQDGSGTIRPKNSELERTPRALSVIIENQKYEGNADDPISSNANVDRDIGFTWSKFASDKPPYGGVSSPTSKAFQRGISHPETSEITVVGT